MHACIALWPTKTAECGREVDISAMLDFSLCDLSKVESLEASLSFLLNVGEAKHWDVGVDPLKTSRMQDNKCYYVL